MPKGKPSRRFWRKSGRPAAQRAASVSEPPIADVELHRPGSFSTAVGIVPLPCGNRVVTASWCGSMCVFAAASGAFERELDAHSGNRRHLLSSGLCALGGDVIASGGWQNGEVVTWNAATGARLCEKIVSARDGDYVSALVSLGDRGFAAGTADGDVVLCVHSGGRDVTEASRISCAHQRSITDLAARGGRLATASENVAAVWDVASRERLATLDGHTDVVRAVDMSDQLVATGSYDLSVRVYSVASGYKRVAKFERLHTRYICFVKIIGEDAVASAGYDGAVRVARVSSPAVVTGKKLDHPVNFAAILPDGRLAVGGVYVLSLIAPPERAAEAFKAHGVAAFLDNTAVAPVLAVAKSLPPLQASVVRVVAGDLSAAVACRDLISERACSVSLAEWWSAHVLLMRAVRDGDIPTKTDYEGEENWWFRCLYAQARKLVVGEKSRASVLKCVRDAYTVGVLETTESTVATIIARQDLEEVVLVFRTVEEQIVTAVGQLFIRQAETDQRLTEHMAKFRRFRDVQRVTQLVGAVFSVIPFASAAVAGAGGLVEVAWGSLETTNVIESLVGIGAGSQAFVSEPFVDRFMRVTRNVLNENVYNAMPEESRQMLDNAIANIGMTVDGMRALAMNVVEGRANVDEVIDAYDATGVGRLEDAEGDLRQSDGGGLAGAEDGGASDCVEASVRTCEDAANDLWVESNSVDHPSCGDTNDGAEINLDGDSEQNEEACVTDELKILEKKGLEMDAVLGMKTDQLASALAAFIVAYDCDLWDQFVEFRVCLSGVFRKRRVHGRRLVGKYSMSADAFYKIAMNALTSSKIETDAETDGHCIREFFDRISGS